jgi:hypothetical protein
MANQHAPRSSTGLESTGSGNISQSSAPIRTDSNSGLSLLLPVGSSPTDPIYAYYQSPDTSIIEISYNNISFDAVATNNTVVNASVAAKGTPLAATSWFNDGAVVRQLFYFDTNGAILTQNTTGTNGWQGTATSILTGDSADLNSPALAAVAGTANSGSGLDGIRVYYGSQLAFIREVGTDFSDSTSNHEWHMWYSFTGSSNEAGVDCVIVNNFNHLYLRNSTTGALQQWQWDYFEQVNMAWTMSTSLFSLFSFPSGLFCTNMY